MAGDPRLPGGIDRISGLTDDLLGHILSFMPVWEAVRLSALSRRWRGAWAHAPVLNISDKQHPDRFLDFAGAALARYGQPDIPSLAVTIGRRSSLGPATAAWLRGAMEHVVGSIRVQVDRHTPPLDQLVLPRSLRATAMALDLSGDVLSKGVLVLPEPAEPAPFRRMTELSLSSVRLQVQPDRLGEFLSSCFPQLRKLRLRKVCNVAAEPRLWPLMLDMDMLELEVDSIHQLTVLQVVAAKLRLLIVRHCFESLAVLRADIVFKVFAPGLEVISWTGWFPKQLNFLPDAQCVRRLSGIIVNWPSISWADYCLPGVMQLLETCCGADRLDLCVDIYDGWVPSMVSKQDFMERMPHLPNIRTLSLTIVAILRMLRSPIGEIVFCFLRRCPNLTLLHIDLSTLHQFTRQDPRYLVFPEDDAETKAAKPCQDREYDPRKAHKYQLRLGSLRKIRISGFAGTDAEMELADLLFGIGAERSALEGISISSFAQLKGRIGRIAQKMRARFPLVGGRWEISSLEESTWTKNNDGLERSNALRSTTIM
ncbi:putative F-box/FBD/LRR-repeat protein At4g03220 isoform X1 [Aegilops tauschii subsp. strangulata]|uniref:F-box domain-containing protein n=1 Tax=Triticum aestivum TaxID=4565 RepID=A0A3B6A096_WHEAT|nr:putative F-box/FBD/LRR-repeat protein At4g03220 [Aegilops tauschii subsp. strangulata]XP_044445614.1 putative F-box/FBD/LRR-repeat protein At4g03220 [Triticum aestivum]